MWFGCVVIAAAVAGGVVVCEGSGMPWRRLGVEPGPSVEATRGEIWPQPQAKVAGEGFFIVRPDFFHFKVTGKDCGILQRALQRYKQELKAHDKARRTVESEVRRGDLLVDENFRGYLDELSVNLGAPCEEMPHADMDEHYELRIDTEDYPNAGALVSESIWGILRGLETWSQLVHASSDYSALVVNGSSIMDFPRFPYRGLLIDTSRHFLPLRTISSMLDAMAMNKMNVLHWHVVDDQSFPFQSRTFPNLSAAGAYAPGLVYTPEDVQSVIAYAADRGIRVIPEFDTPGHTRSWGQGHPELLTTCYRGLQPDGSLGPINPTVPGTYDFMRLMMKEVSETFPESYVHLGGDEVDFECWVSNPEVEKFMKAKNWTPRKLEEMYVTRIIEMAKELSLTSMVWQEVFDNGAALPNATVIHVWKGDHRRELSAVTQGGHRAVLSSCWYLDGLRSGGDWQRFYGCDPEDFYGSDRQKRLVLGGEACMWGEVVDASNALSRVWPRACAAAEKLWSPARTADFGEAARRLEEHTCRMNRKKIPAQPPNGPGFCPGTN